MAIDALNSMAIARTNVFDFPDYREVKPVTQGVAKLGWSWEALDVRKWSDAKTLHTALVDLGEQQGSHMEYVFVQVRRSMNMITMHYNLQRMSVVHRFDICFYETTTMTIETTNTGMGRV